MSGAVGIGAPHLIEVVVDSVVDFGIVTFEIEKVVEIELVGHVGVFVGVAIEGCPTRR